MALENSGGGAAPASSPTTSASTTPAAAPVSAPATTSTPAAPLTARQSVEATAARLAAADSPSAEPANVGAQQTSAQSPAEATPQPTSTDSNDPDTITGAVPPERLKSIVNNVRQKAASNAVTELLSGLGVSDVAEVRSATDIHRRLAQDPVAFYQQLGRELQESPDYATRLQQPATSQQDPEPQADMYTDVNGQRVEVYSATQLREWHQWNRRQEAAERQREMAPLSEFVQTEQQRREHEQIRVQSRTEATSMIEEMRAYPHFTKENEPKIAQRFAQMDPALRKRLGSAGALQRAYNDFLREEVFPNIDREAESRVRGDFTRRAAVQSVRPGGGQSNGTRRPTTPAELSAHMARLAGQQ